MDKKPPSSPPQKMNSSASSIVSCGGDGSFECLPLHDKFNADSAQPKEVKKKKVKEVLFNENLISPEGGGGIKGIVRK